MNKTLIILGVIVLIILAGCTNSAPQQTAQSTGTNSAAPASDDAAIQQATAGAVDTNNNVDIGSMV